MAPPLPTSRCTYPLCRGFPKPMMKKCNKCQTRYLHHLCQIEYESIHCDPYNIDLGLLHSCYSCLLKVIETEKKRLGVREGSISPIPPLLTQPPMPSLLTQPPEHESSNSIPTNVAPRRVHFKPPGEIETLTRPTNKPQLTQRGFKGNSGIFCVEILYYGKARASSISTDKFGYGKIVGVPNKKSKIDYYSIRYDCAIEDESICHYSTQIPNTPALKKLLKEAIARANEKDYHFVQRREENRNTAPQTETETDTILIPGVLQERLNLGNTVLTGDDDDSNESVSNDGSNCDMEESAFQTDLVEIEDKEEDDDIFGSNWSWKRTIR